MDQEQFNVAKMAFRSGNYAKAKYIFDYALDPLTFTPKSEPDSLAWVEYASTCQMIGYYNEAERVYKMCNELGFYKDFVCNELIKNAERKSKKQIPLFTCNNEKLRSTLSSIIPCFPRIKKDIIAFIGSEQTEFDDFFINTAHFKKTYKLSDYSKIACGFYDNPEKYVLVFNEKFFSVFKTDSEIIGDCAHEMAHFSLASGMTIPEVCYYFDSEIQFKVNSTISDDKYMTGDGHDFENNEYLTDATVISCGFAYDLSAAWRAYRKFEGALSAKLIPPEIIDAFWHKV